MSDPLPLATPSYRCQQADVARDRDEILAIWRGNLGIEGKLVAKLEWFYAGGEAGSPVAILLRDESTGRRVGFAAAGPRRASWRGRDVRIGVLVDMAVIPEHRSLFPALSLQRAMRQSVPDRLAALYGFPNPKAVPVFARVGYVRALEVRRLVRVLRPGVYLRRRLPAWLAAALGALLEWPLRAWERLRAPAAGALVASWRADVDPRADRLWQETPHGDGPIVIRDSGFLRWRFDQKPGATGRYLVVESGDGGLAAWFACEDDGPTLMVRDFWTRGGYDAIEPAIVWLLLREARARGCTAVGVEFGGSANIIRALTQAGFSERSRRPFFAYLGPDPALVGEARWYVTSADEDE